MTNVPWPFRPVWCIVGKLGGVGHKVWLCAWVVGVMGGCECESIVMCIVLWHVWQPLHLDSLSRPSLLNGIRAGTGLACTSYITGVRGWEV